MQKVSGRCFKYQNTTTQGVVPALVSGGESFDNY